MRFDRLLEFLVVLTFEVELIQGLVDGRDVETLLQLEEIFDQCNVSSILDDFDGL